MRPLMRSRAFAASTASWKATKACTRKMGGGGAKGREGFVVGWGRGVCVCVHARVVTLSGDALTSLRSLKCVLESDEGLHERHTGAVR